MFVFQSAEIVRGGQDGLIRFNCKIDGNGKCEVNVPELDIKLRPGRSLRSTVPRATQAETPGAGEKRCRQVTHWLGTLLWKIRSSSGLMGVSVTGPGLSFLSGSPHLFREVLRYPNVQARQMSEFSVAVGGQSADLGMFRPRPGLFLRVHRGRWASISEQQNRRGPVAPPSCSACPGKKWQLAKVEDGLSLEK